MTVRIDYPDAIEHGRDLCKWGGSRPVLSIQLIRRAYAKTQARSEDSPVFHH
jgi:hypothetical protein